MKEKSELNMVDLVALVFGIIYLGAGIVGFALAPNGGSLLGILEVSVFHHIFHIGIGALGIAAGSLRKNMGRTYCLGAGVLLVILSVLGFIIPMPFGMVLASPTANLLTDNMLHLVTGVILGYFGWTAPVTNLRR